MPLKQKSLGLDRKIIDNLCKFLIYLSRHCGRLRESCMRKDKASSASGVGEHAQALCLRMMLGENAGRMP
jgi:hypothetical protein